MFGKAKLGDSIDSLIGHGSCVTGDLAFTGGLRIDGLVIGNVLGLSGKDSTLVVSEKARIQGKVTCARLILNGEIDGPIEIHQYVELQPKARVKGDLTYSMLEMHPGAVIEGRLIHVGDAKREESKRETPKREEVVIPQPAKVD